MDAYSIIGISFSLSFAGLGIALGARLLQFQRTSSSGTTNSTTGSTGSSNQAQRQRDQLHPEARAEQMRHEAMMRRRLHRPPGTLRRTSIHGINERGWLRHTDGSYTRAFRVEMPATLYADDAQVDRIYNDFARTLQSVGLAGVVLQLRHDVWSDQGRALGDHLTAQAPAADSFMPARMLHTVGLTGTESLARQGAYRDDRLTLWVRIPTRHPSDPSRSRVARVMRFFPLFISEVRRRGANDLLAAFNVSRGRSTLETLAVKRAVAASAPTSTTWRSVCKSTPVPMPDPPMRVPTTARRCRRTPPDSTTNSDKSMPRAPERC